MKQMGALTLASWLIMQIISQGSLERIISDGIFTAYFGAFVMIFAHFGTAFAAFIGDEKLARRCFKGVLTGFAVFIVSPLAMLAEHLGRI